MVKVAQIMARTVETISPSATVQEAAQRMKIENVGSLPVCVDSSLVGIITDRDLTLRVTAEGRDARSTPVGEIMTEAVVTVGAQESLSAVEHLMEEHRIRRLPVVEMGRVVGYVTLSAIALWERDAGIVAKLLKGISQPEPAASKN